PPITPRAVADDPCSYLSVHFGPRLPSPPRLSPRRLPAPGLPVSRRPLPTTLRFAQQPRPPRTDEPSQPRPSPHDFLLRRFPLPPSPTTPDASSREPAVPNRLPTTKGPP